MTTVFIAVHPHNAYGVYEKDPVYVQRRNARLSDRRLEHVLLIDEPINPEEGFLHDVNHTHPIVGLDHPYWDNRVFFTHSGDSASDWVSERQISFDELSRIILTRFPADQYVFWGAEVHRPPKDLSTREPHRQAYWRDRQPYGCVFFYHETLALPNKSIDFSHCLTADF